MYIEDFSLDDAFSVAATGTSDGTQDKYFKDGFWFKADRVGGEGIAETAAAIVLKESGMSARDFVEYFPCRINGKNGCCSKNFLSEGESFITIYRLFKNIRGADLAEVCARMDYDDGIEYVLDFVKQQTGLDIHEYLANIFLLDKLILNEDRHFNNLGVIYTGAAFRTAPIFDNGKAFLIGNKQAKEKNALKEKIACATAKSFSPSFDVNFRYLRKSCTLDINRACIDKIAALGNEEIVDVLKFTFDSIL